jgi:hypothetical protein
MAIPLITYNPWKFNSDNGLPERIIFPEIVYIFEKNLSIL